jgi:hypothetical protein
VGLRTRLEGVAKKGAPAPAENRIPIVQPVVCRVTDDANSFYIHVIKHLKHVYEPKFVKNKHYTIGDTSMQTKEVSS